MTDMMNLTEMGISLTNLVVKGTVSIVNKKKS